MQVRARGESPIELHLLFVPESELNGAPRQKRGAPGAAVTGEEKIELPERPTVEWSVNI
jgi:hypothetical protein